MKISIVTAIGPLKHYKKFISRYIKNVTSQTIFKECEVVLAYMEWDEEFKQLDKFDNVKYVLDDKGRGPYHGWNIGIKASDGAYVTNWNIDDIRHPTSLERQAKILDNDNDIDLVYNYHLVTNDCNETFDNLDGRKERYIKLYPDECHKIVHQCCMCGPDPLWRKSLHDSLGYFDYENYPSIADWDMWIRMAENGSKFKLIPLPLCLFYDGASGVSNRYADSRETIENTRLYQHHQEGFDNLVPVNWTIRRLHANEKGN